MIGTLPPQGADGEQLHQRDDAGDGHGVLQQRRAQRAVTGVRRQAAGAHDDNQRGQVADEHGHDVLQAEWDGLLQGKSAIKGIRRAGFRSLGLLTHLNRSL